MIDTPASGSRQLFGIWTLRRLICVCQQYLSIVDFYLHYFQLLTLMFLLIQYWLPQGWGFCGGVFLVDSGRVCFIVLRGLGAGGLVTKLAAIGQIGKCAVTVIPHSGHGTLPAGSADWHRDSLTESVFGFAFVCLAWFCLQFPSQDLIYFGDFKTKSTSGSASSGHEDKKIRVCVYT